MQTRRSVRGFVRYVKKSTSEFDPVYDIGVVILLAVPIIGIAVGFSALFA